MQFRQFHIGLTFPWNFFQMEKAFGGFIDDLPATRTILEKKRIWEGFEKR
jgi:hypothetical protein